MESVSKSTMRDVVSKLLVKNLSLKHRKVALNEIDNGGGIHEEIC